ncbi:MAG: hypothetical protein PHS54_04740 [Clostridia bacterium]|jgi:hypothetical protein|nr:hypothetical protein [Clostridia bacterium]
MAEPIKKISAGRLSVSVFENINAETGNKYNSYVLQKSYKKDDNWVNKSINLNSRELGELLVLAQEISRFDVIKQ